MDNPRRTYKPDYTIQSIVRFDYDNSGSIMILMNFSHFFGIKFLYYVRKGLSRLNEPFREVLHTYV